MYLPQKAIDEFLTKPRDDMRGFKHMTPVQIEALKDQLPITPPLWHKLRRHQKIGVLLGTKFKRFAYWYDTGCLAGETLLETDQGPKRIDQLEQAGHPIRVLSLTERGLCFVDATCPFRRGPTELYRVRFLSGRSIIVTGKHRFLTQDGWITCAELSCGVQLPLFSACRDASPSLPAPSAQASEPYSFSYNDLLACDFPFDTALSIEHARTDYYYDLHVPIYENYIAHGLCHHNTGKTLLSLSLARFFIDTAQAKRFLVLTAANINRGEWADEIKKHSPDTMCTILTGSSKHKWDQLIATEDDIVVATYAGFTKMVCELVSVPRKKKRELQISPALIDVVRAKIDGLILDEFIFVGSHRALIFDICCKLVKSCAAVFNLCGTPFGRDPTPLWSQMFLIDGGESLGKGITIFRKALFKEEPNQWSGFSDWKFLHKNTPVLNRMIAHRSLRYEADPADLPAVVHIVKRVSLVQSTNSYYEEAKETIRKANGNEMVIKSAFLRMRQIASGFLGYKDDEAGAKAQVEFAPNNKLEMLIALVRSIYLDHKVLVLHDFVTSGRMICRELDQLEIPYAKAFGQTKDVHAEKARFQHDPECNVFVINTSGAYGINLQAAQYGIFFESPVSPILRKQMERRFCRQESAHKTVYCYDLLVRGSVEEKIRNFHKTGNDLLRAIIDREVLL